MESLYLSGAKENSRDVFFFFALVSKRQLNTAYVYIVKLTPLCSSRWQQYLVLSTIIGI